MAKAVKAPIRTKTEAFRGASYAVEGGAVADGAWFNAQNPNRCHQAALSAAIVPHVQTPVA